MKFLKVDLTGVQEMDNSTKYGEIGEMGWPNTGGSGNGEFEEIWRNRGNGMDETPK